MCVVSATHLANDAETNEIFPCCGLLLFLWAGKSCDDVGIKNEGVEMRRASRAGSYEGKMSGVS